MTRSLLTSILASALCCGLTTSCLMNPTPPPPPFHITEYGAGFDISHTGKRFVFKDEKGKAIGQVRVSSHSLRLQHPDATAIGSVRITADGYAYRTRGGNDVCTLAADTHTVTCDEDQTWEAVVRPKGVEITDPQGDRALILAHSTTLSIQRGGSSWSPLAASVLAHDFEIDPGEDHRFGALALIAWSLRDTPTIQRTQSGSENQETAPLYGPPNDPSANTSEFDGPTLPDKEPGDPGFVGPTRTSTDSHSRDDSQTADETKNIGTQTQK